MLKFINNELEKAGIPYEFMRWTGELQYPYFVGEYTEFPPATEDGCKESTMIITGFTRESWMELESYRAKIERHFPAAGGLRGRTSSGVIAVFYGGASPIPTGEADLKKIQINLDIKEWRNF